LAAVSLITALVDLPPQSATAQSLEGVVTPPVPPVVETPPASGDATPVEEALDQPATNEAPRPDLTLEPEPLVGPMSAPITWGADAPPPAVRPVSWISGPYFKAGVAMPLGGGILENQDTGYTIAGGYRQPFGPEIAGDRAFFDLGLTYLNAFGENTQFISERRITSVFGSVTDVETFTDRRLATLHELRCSSLDAALGWYWGPPLDNRNADPQLRIATRLGGRVGHARGHFIEEQLPVDLINNATTVQTLLTDPYERTDTFGGLFVGTEAILLQRQYAIGHIQWTLDGQYANNWIDIGGGWDGSLATASVMLGFMLSR
jgi:hypothetical protein